MSQAQLLHFEYQSALVLFSYLVILYSFLQDFTDPVSWSKERAIFSFSDFQPAYPFVGYIFVHV